VAVDVVMELLCGCCRPSYVEKLHLFYDEEQLEAYRTMKEAEEEEARRREAAERARNDLEEDGDISSFDDVFGESLSQSVCCGFLTIPK
jgi:hypothetical protein